jgi:hypothetical protein
MGLRAEEVILSPNAHRALEHLKRSPEPPSASVARRVRGLKSVLLADCLHGEVVKKDRIPRGLEANYGLENLYIVDLPSFWRLLYTIVRDRGKRYIIVVEIVDHETYDQWFPGRGR